MRRIKLFLSVAAVMVAMMAVSALPAVAHERDHDFLRFNHNHPHFFFDDRLDRFDSIVVDEDLDELCSPLNSEFVNDSVPGCIFD